MWRDSEGSMTVEAMLIVPAVLLLMVVFMRWGLMLHSDLQGMVEVRSEAAANEPEAQGRGLAAIGFLRGGPPARRIRDADLLIDLGYSIKERLPAWFRP